jgi:hypothetical protein
MYRFSLVQDNGILMPIECSYPYLFICDFLYTPEIHEKRIRGCSNESLSYSDWIETLKTDLCNEIDNQFEDGNSIAIWKYKDFPRIAIEII